MTATAQRGWREHALSTLAGAGHRQGAARRAVIEVLASHRCAVSAHEIEQELRLQGTPVGRASIYRTLESLTELRLLSRLDVGRGSAAYEIAHPTGEHHHHLVCDTCGSVSPFEDPQLERAIHALEGRVDFRVAEHDVVLHGECGDCAPEGRR
jgi:Fur family ferric uptake transcriptional regulator